MTAVATRFNGISVTPEGEVIMSDGSRTWGYVNHRRGPYLRCNVGNSGRLVHRLVAQTLVHNPCPDFLNVVHHINGDIYWNAECNLMWVNTQLNCMMKSNARGCYFDKKRKMWEAKITVKGRLYHIGFFKTFLEGHRAYKVFRQEKFNEILNELQNARTARTYSFI